MVYGHCFIVRYFAVNWRCVVSNIIIFASVIFMVIGFSISLDSNNIHPFLVVAALDILYAIYFELVEIREKLK